MAQETVEQLREEAARQQGLATASKAKLDKEKLTLQQQQGELRKIQSDIVALGQAASGAAAPAQQQIANSIIILEQRKSRLQQTINQTNNRINALATETVNYENTASQLNQQADTLVADQLNPPQPVPSQVSPVPLPIGQVKANPEFGNPDIEVNIDTPLQPNSIVVPDETEFVGPPVSTITSPRPTPTVPYGPSRDDEGNLLPGYEDGGEDIGDQYIGPNYISSSIQASANASRGLSINKRAAQGAPSNNNVQGQETLADWRVKLSLAEGQEYLYQSPQPGILSPLKATKGVIFPYVPAVSVNYTAGYDATELTHSNYKIFSYRQSSIDNISIVGDFTAQDTAEANYLLAVIHFFRSVTKMFYGLDNNPKPGTPPPLCFLTGLGTFQFDNHPLVITNFNYTLPTDVDYIRAGFFTNTQAGVTQAPNNTNTTPSAGSVRLPGILKPGGIQGPPQWKTAIAQPGQPSYVPTKMSINITALPIVTRSDISNNFSLKDYASGKIYSRGNKSRGIW